MVNIPPEMSSSTEKLYQNNEGVMFFNSNMLPVRQHQGYEELMQFQRELAGEIYFQRTLEKHL